MGYKIPDKMSADALKTFCTKTISALKAHGTKITIPQTILDPWIEFRTKVRAHLSEREQLEEQATETRAVLEVTDTYWDANLGKCSSESYHVSGKKADNEPYRSLFGTIKAVEAKVMGPTQATLFGEQLIARANVINHEELKAPFNQFALINGELKTAGLNRDAKTLALELHTLKVKPLLNEAQDLLNKTEAQLLSLYPGNDALIRSTLNPRED